MIGQAVPPEGIVAPRAGYVCAMVREFASDAVRGAGPAVVWEGPEDAPVIIVLDPAGEAKHGQVPATWRPLAEHLRVGWFRLPAEAGDEPTVEDVIGHVTRRMHLVASGTAAEPALRLALEHAGLVRSLVVVDPAPVDPSTSTIHDYQSAVDWWNSETEATRRRLLADGVRLGAFVSRESDPAVRVEPPVPLGHPDVVGRVVQTLLSFEGNRADAEPVEPERAEVADAWHAVQERFGPPLERARRTGG